MNRVIKLDKEATDISDPIKDVKTTDRDEPLTDANSLLVKEADSKPKVKQRILVGDNQKHTQVGRNG